MVMKTTFEQELKEIVYGLVKRGDYPEPTPTIDDQISSVVQHLEDLKNERILRPPTAQEYFDLLDSLNSQLSDLQKQNEQILIDNKLARQAVDDKFLSDIETAKKDPVNIRNAEIAVLVYNKSLEQAADSLVSDALITSKEKDDYLAKTVQVVEVK